jgi:hypothetical protein
MLNNNKNDGWIRIEGKKGDGNGYLLSQGNLPGSPVSVLAGKPSDPSPFPLGTPTIYPIAPPLKLQILIILFLFFLIDEA